MKAPFFHLRFCALAVILAAPAAMWASPTLTKAFGAPTIPLNGTTSLTFTISPSDAATWNSIGFSDTLPAGLVVATPNGLDISQCAGVSVTATAESNSITVPVQAITPTTCTITLNVRGIAVGIQTNTTSALTIQSGDGQTPAATASVTVIGPPTISKAFGAANIAVGASTSLNFTITNPNASSSLTGVGITDSLPAGLIVATPNGLTGSCGGGTITATAGIGSVSLSGATLAANASCNFSVNVTGTTAGVKNNTTSAVTSNEAGSGNTASASLIVASAPTISKAFGVASIPVGASTSLSFTITNPNISSSLTAVGFTDSLPAGMTLTTPNGLTGSCGGGTISATAGSGSLSLSGATLAASASCTFSVNVVGSTVGTMNNTTTAVTSNEAGNGNTASASLFVQAHTQPVPALSPAAFGGLALLLAGLGWLQVRKIQSRV